MALRIIKDYPPGASLGVSIQRLADGLVFDFAADTFGADPTILIAELPEETTGPYAGKGRYSLTIGGEPVTAGSFDPLPIDQFSDGNYCVTIHDLNDDDAILGLQAATLYLGDDAPVFPGSGPGGAPTALEVAAATWSWTSRQLTANGLNLIVIDGRPVPVILGHVGSERVGVLRRNPTTGELTYDALDGSEVRIRCTPTATERIPTLTDPPLP